MSAYGKTLMTPESVAAGTDPQQGDCRRARLPDLAEKRGVGPDRLERQAQTRRAEPPRYERDLNISRAAKKQSNSAARW